MSKGDVTHARRRLDSALATLDEQSEYLALALAMDGLLISLEVAFASIDDEDKNLDGSLARFKESLDLVSHSVDADDLYVAEFCRFHLKIDEIFNGSKITFFELQAAEARLLEARDKSTRARHVLRHIMSGFTIEPLREFCVVPKQDDAPKDNFRKGPSPNVTVTFG